MPDFGGIMRFTVGGSPIELRAQFTHDLSPFEIDGGANQSGSIYRTLKPTGYVIDVTFEDSDGVDVEAVILGGPYNCTLVEESTRHMFTWTGASFQGKPRVDRMTGEITGVTARVPAGGFRRVSI